jgi:putative protease
MRTPELLASAGSLEEIKQYIEAGADAVAVGEHRWGMRLPGECSLEDIEAALEYTRGRGARLYVTINSLIANDDLEALEVYIQRLGELKPDAIVFGDPAVLMTLQEQGIVIPLHWNTEMTSTNYATAEYWATKGAVRVIAARELNLEELHEFKRHSKMELQVQAHGITNIYHSRRQLLQSYMGHIHKASGSVGAEEGLYLIEHERPELKLPIYEDHNGTHIMSADDVCVLDALDELLEQPIDSLKIETLLKPLEYNTTVIRNYRKALDAWAKQQEKYSFQEEWIDEIRALQDPNRELSYGFFFKEQVY